MAIIVGLLVLASLGLIFAGKASKNTSVTSPNQLKVTTSFYPLYFFASQIGGDKAQVVNITPSGAEPHDYEPTTGDIARIEKSNILILNGGGLEPWGERINSELQPKTIVIDAATDLINQSVETEGKVVKDPHVWIDPILAKAEVKKISEGFIKADASNKELYAKNSNQLQIQLDNLDQQFRDGLANCKQKNIITSHQAFGYIASRYGLVQIPISGLSPDLEPSPSQLIKISRFAKTIGAKYIFFETLVSPRLSQTIAQEVGAKTIVFNPLEGLTSKEAQAGKNYFSIQKENLANLKIALNCL